MRSDKHRREKDVIESRLLSEDERVWTSREYGYGRVLRFGRLVTRERIPLVKRVRIVKIQETTVYNWNDISAKV